jgi:exodeoxyribonuclease-3
VTVRFLTWNVRTGGSGGRLDALVTLLQRERPDILALQELRGFPGRRMAEVAGALGMTPFLARSVFGQSVAVLVRPPLRIVDWSGVRWRLHHAAAAVRVPTTAGQLTVVSTHLNALSPYRRLREARFLAARYRPAKGPVLLAGDLNSLDPGTDHTARLAALSEPYRHRHVTAHTTPTTRGGGQEFSAAGMRLDYLMASPSVAARAAHARVLRGAEAEYASDHYPLAADLDL